MAIKEIIIPYPDFIMGEVIDPEQFNLNNDYMIRKTNELLDVLNQITDGIEGGSGASIVNIDAIAPFLATDVQSFLQEVIDRLTSTTDGVSGADFIGSTLINGVAGDTVQAQLESLKVIADNQKAFHLSEVARLDGRIDSNVAEITSLKTRATSVENRATSLEGRATANETDISTLKTRATNVENRATALESGKANKVDVYTKQEIDARKVTTPMIQDFAVTSQKIANQAITADKIHPSLVTNVSISVHKNLSVLDHPDESVTTEKIRDLGVTTRKLANENVTTEKLAPESVTYDKLGLDVEHAILNADKIADDNGGKWRFGIANGSLYVEQVE